MTLMKNISRYARILKSLAFRRPILVIFDVTRRCNQRCRMCNIWRTESNDMTLAEITVMAEKLARTGVGYVFLQGGEPTLRSDLIGLVDAFSRFGIKPTVITNGILLRDELARQLAARPCNVAISLDTLNPETFKLLRGVDAFRLVRENIESASAILPRKGNWSVTSTITELSSLEELKELEAFARRLGFMHAARPYVHVGGAAGRKDDILAYRDTGRIAEIFTYLRDEALKTNFLAGLIYEEHIKYVAGEPQPDCDALTRSMVMSPEGGFSPCIEFTGESIALDEMFRKRAEWLERCRACNHATPCFYNDAREIGILVRKKWRVLPALPKIAAQLARHGNFF